MSIQQYKHVRQFFRRLRFYAAPLVLSGAIVASIGLYAAPVAATYYCGAGKDAVATSIDLGCRGSNCKDPHKAGDKFCTGDRSSIIDLLFAIVRFLSAGAGLVIIGSVVYAGIQYTVSRGDPNATANAVKRIRNTVIALGIYIFAFAILNFLTPAGFFST